MLQITVPRNDIPLFAALLIGGVPMVWQLPKKLFRGFGLAGVSILGIRVHPGRAVVKARRS
jgi:hypothetical protein